MNQNQQQFQQSQKKLNLSSEDDSDILGERDHKRDEDEDDEEQVKRSKKFDTQQDEEEDIEDKITTKLYNFFLFLFSNIIFYIEFLFLPFPMIFLGFYVPFMGLKFNKVLQILLALWISICNFSIVYTVLNLFYFKLENDNLNYMFVDSMFFYLNSIFVFSFIKTNHEQITSFGQAFSKVFSKYSFSTFQYLFTQANDSQAYLFDYHRFNANNAIKNSGISKLSQQYSLFTFQRSKEKQNIFKLNELTEFEKYLIPSFKQYFILIAVISIKIFLSFQYLFLQETKFTKQIWIDLIVNIFLYFYTCFNLNRILGSYDLRKKQKVLSKLNELVNFREMTKKNITTAKDKIDFTCPISMEAWDNYRKIILTNESEYVSDIELSYFCLFFYFIFVTLIVFSSFFDLYWIFPKESVLLNPIYVIMSSFDFVFLSLFLMFRFYIGNQFNDTFEEMDLNLGSLLDVVDDLIVMYDYYFDQKLGHIPEDKVSKYGLVIKKIKLLSKQYINTREQLDGVIYSMNEKGILRLKLLESIKRSLKKIKRSVEADSKEFRYLFLNLVEVNFFDTLTSLTIALVTTLPTIVPKFIEFYTKEPATPEPSHSKFL